MTLPHFVMVEAYEPRTSLNNKLFVRNVSLNLEKMVPRMVFSTMFSQFQNSSITYVRTKTSVLIKKLLLCYFSKYFCSVANNDNGGV